MTAPEVLQVEPEMGTTSFASDRFRIYFDEYVQLNDIANELLVSPPLQSRPEVQVRKKYVEVSWDEELMPNTTYTFNFGEGIRDVNEGNVAAVNYVFSTGEVLDSLSLRGVVLDAFTNLPVSGARVMLYRNMQDTTPMTERPTYFGRTAEDGSWEINFLKDEELGIFALKEEFGNYLYDSPTESIAFQDSLVQPLYNDSTQLITLRMATQKDTVQYIEDWKADSIGQLKLKLHGPAEELSLRTLNHNLESSDWISTQGRSDTLFYWRKGSATNKELLVEVSDRGVVLDTVRVDDYLRIAPAAFKLSCPPRTFNNDSSLIFPMGAPVEAIDTSKIQLVLDSIPQEFSVNYTPEEPVQLAIASNFEAGRTYKLLMLPGALNNERYATNDTLVCTCQAFKDDYYADLVLTLDIGETKGNFILQFVAKGDKVSKEIKIGGSTEITLRRTEPGTYKLRLINDLNGDGAWTTLDYADHRQAEKVYYFNSELVLRSNWEQKLEWKINALKEE